MKYKISFLGTPIRSLKREVYTIICESESDDRETIIIQGIYRGKNDKGVKFYNVSWDSISIGKAKK